MDTHNCACEGIGEEKMDKYKGRKNKTGRRWRKANVRRSKKNRK
jgi:hypothetical protein